MRLQKKDVLENQSISNTSTDMIAISTSYRKFLDNQHRSSMNESWNVTELYDHRESVYWYTDYDVFVLSGNFL